MKLLHIDSSILGDNSASRQLSAGVVKAWQAAEPGVEVTYRDVAAEGLNHFSGATLGALGTPADQRNAAQQHEAELSAKTLAEFLAADAVVIAADPDSQVLGLVANAWAGFGAAFGPLILLSLTWPRMTGAGAVAGLITGAVVVIAWIALGLSGTLYEIVPGFIASWIAIVVVSRATPDLGEYRAPKNA